MILLVLLASRSEGELNLSFPLKIVPNVRIYFQGTLSQLLTKIIVVAMIKPDLRALESLGNDFPFT